MSENQYKVDYLITSADDFKCQFLRDFVYISEDREKEIIASQGDRSGGREPYKTYHLQCDPTWFQNTQDFEGILASMPMNIFGWWDCFWKDQVWSASHQREAQRRQHGFPFKIKSHFSLTRTDGKSQRDSEFVLGFTMGNLYIESNKWRVTSGWYGIRVYKNEEMVEEWGWFLDEDGARTLRQKRIKRWITPDPNACPAELNETVTILLTRLEKACERLQIPKEEFEPALGYDRYRVNTSTVNSICSDTQEAKEFANAYRFWSEVATTIPSKADVLSICRVVCDNLVELNYLVPKEIKA